MFAKTNDIFTLTIISRILAYPLCVVGTIQRKTHFQTVREVYEHKLCVDNLANISV